MSLPDAPSASERELALRQDYLRVCEGLVMCQYALNYVKVTVPESHAAMTHFWNVLGPEVTSSAHGFAANRLEAVYSNAAAHSAAEEAEASNLLLHLSKGRKRR